MEQSAARKLINSNRAAFLLAGSGIATWAPLIPIVQEKFGLNSRELGMLLLCLGIGGFCCMPFSGLAASRMGCRGMARLGACTMTCGLLGVVLSPSVHRAAPMLFLIGISSVLIEVAANINAARIEHLTGRILMSGLHGIYSVGSIIGTVRVTVFLSAGLSMNTVEACALTLFVLIAVLFFNHLLNRQQTKSEDEEEHAAKEQGKQGSGKAKNSRLQVPGVVYVLGLMCFVLFATECSMIDWSGVFLKQERQVAPEHAGWGYAAFSVAMTIFRLTGDKIVTAMGRRRVLAGGSLCIVPGCLLVVGIDSVFCTVAGYFDIGVGASNIVPQLISLSAAVKGISMNASVTAVNAFVYTGGLAGPALIGCSAQAFGLPETFLIQASLVLLVGIGSCLMLKKPSPEQFKAMVLAEKTRHKKLQKISQTLNKELQFATGKLQLFW